jgi:outer membrane protein OmpA-like peptidoglycan-associated protein
MRNPRYTTMLAALMIAAGMTFAPAASVAQNVKNLSVEQLLERQQELQSAVANGAGNKQKRQLRRVRRELLKRQAQTNQNPQPQPQPQVQQQQQPQSQEQQQQQQQSGNVNRQARRYLRAGNVRRLNDVQLRDTVRDGRRLLNDPGLRGNLQRKVRDRVQAARGEEQRRVQAAQQQQQQNQQQQNQQQQQQQQQSGNVNRQARRYLRAGNVRRLNDVQLRDTVRDGRRLLNDPGLRGNLQRKVRDRVQAARGERQRRNQAAEQPQQPQPGSTLEAEARRLLNDTRPASALGDDQLRHRLGEARRLIGTRGLDRRLFRQVRRMARTDRTELRARVARRDASRVERQGDRQDVRQLLRDQRSPRQLNDRQLQARIKSARDLLDSKNLRPGQKDRLEELLREARREKRRRLIAGRQERRERLRANRANEQIIIQIPQSRSGADRDDIDAAEADDELLQRQLVAPPRRQIKRKYSRQDFRTGRPAERRSMPAIEVDTIRFGFNEAFVREEEIPQLERIGEIIERIVAGNPDEVFLIEGHTDAVGSASYNQGLSAKRANAVRDAMLQFFNIDRANIETVGYGEEFLKINTEEEEQENRRVSIRRITPLLARQ